MGDLPRMPARTIMNTTAPPQSTQSSSRLAFSVQETALMLGVCDKSVRRLILRGLIRPSRALRHILIPKDEIDRFLRETR
jgi:excisionase family DNA binding protein